MNYLKYIEHAAENLQFFLWHRDYTRRFNELPASEQRLSPEWTAAQAEEEAANAAAGKPQSKRLNNVAADMFKGTDFATGPKVTENEKVDPFFTPPRTPNGSDKAAGIDHSNSHISRSITSSADDDRSTLASSQPARSCTKKAEGAFDDAGVTLQPFTVQPFRDEISRVITIYLADGAPRQLNLASRERAALLHALAATTHPTAFRAVLQTVEWSLRCQAHPNFIRWTICNGNRARVVFARGLGVAGILGGLLASLLITLSHAGRGWRVLPFVGYMIGISTLIAAWKGMCVVLHGMHHRHLRPWELFVDHDDEMAEMEGKSSMESLTSSVPSNSYEDEPWVAKYDRRNIIRKVFDREIWIEEPALRQIQDTIFIQSLLGAFIGAAILTGIFCAVPHGNLY
ncbi:hypothetical protein EV356DRAFT_509834 [Viridothelium virens]|uniref:RGS domain-containing protein n=1 Tax=Viridothelium virens TaxID=1048519 RepID=A0A6A6HIP9_VIRVR|nr:hypothetical protein EV356DRAFT_509834 [Viridothelium virens]